MKKCWPYIHIKWTDGKWLATPSRCNVEATGRTPREAYDNWQWFYRLGI